MARERVQIDLPLLLPELPDARDTCVDRLKELNTGESGIERAHVAIEDGSAKLRLHYDPDLLTLAQVERLAMHAGATVTQRFGHVVIGLQAIGSEDAARRIENELAQVNGVLSASAAWASRHSSPRSRVHAYSIRSPCGGLDCMDATTQKSKRL